MTKIVILTFLTLITAVLLISSTTNVNAAAIDTKSQSITILNSVLGIKTDSYSITQNTKQDNLYGAPKDIVYSFFTSEQGSFRATCSYTKGYLNQIYFSDIKGTVQTSQSKTSYIENSKQFLNNFGKNTGDSIYDQFSAMLDNVESGKNASITTKNVNLKINCYEKESSITWTYVDSNGIRANQKHVAFEYENGQLVTFVNTWQLYQVSGTPKITTDQANSLAVEASKTFSYKATVDNKTQKVTGFSIDQKSFRYNDNAISYSNFYEPKNARDSDPFTLYPLWHIFLGFDKFYPGDVSGMNVYIWGDTGKVAGMHEFIVDSSIGGPTSTANMSQDSNSLLNQSSVFSVSMLLTVLASIVLVSPIYCKRFKRTRFFNRKFLAVFFTGLILLSLVLTATSQVNAVSKSRIYSIGDCSNTENGYFNNTADHAEADAIADVCNFVGNLTQDSGYDTSNLYGGGTIASDVYSQAYYDESTYDNTILLHLGHFTSPMGHCYQDVTGDPIRDTNIYAETGNGKHNFVFIWVCNCANNLRDGNGKVQYREDLYEGSTYYPGVPIAWTHRDVLSPLGLMNFDGYNTPDYGGQCYISFHGMSPMLSGAPVVPQPTFEEDTPYNPTNCKEFIKYFYYHALAEPNTIKDALNQASWDYFGCSLLDSPLSPATGEGYNCWWPGSTEQNPKPELRVSGYYPVDFYPTLPLNQMRVHGDSNMHIYKTKTLTVSSSGGGSTNPAVGVQQYVINSIATVTASPASGKVLYNWVLDGTQNLGNALSIDVTMNGDHTLYANFTNAPSPFYPYAYSIQSYTDILYITSNQKSLTGFQPDGYYAGLQSNAPYEVYGQITAALNTATTGYVGVYGAGAGSGTLNVAVSSNGASWVSLGSYTFTSTPQWVDCGVSLSSFSYVRLTADGYQSIIAVDSIRVTPLLNYYLTVYSGSGGYTSPSSGTYQYVESSTAYVTAYADGGYTFNYWLLDGQNVGSSNPIGVSMYSDHTLQPVFSQNTRNLYVYSGSGGYTSPSAGTYQYSYGQTAYVSAYANGGYYFDHWHVDGSDAGSSNPIGVSMYSDHSVQPVFSPVTYSLTVSAINGYGMECSPQVYIDSTYVGNAPVTVYVSAGSHSVWVEEQWVYWYLIGFSDGLGNGDSRSITSNTNIVAWYYP